MLDLIALALAAIPAIVALLALRTWRISYIATKKLELAENVLIGSYQVRDAISSIRHILTFGGEGRTRKAEPDESPEEKKIRDKAFVTFERYNKQKEVFNKLFALRHRFELYFGPEAAKPLDEFRLIRTELLAAARMLARLHLRLIRMQNLPHKTCKPVLAKIEDNEKIIWWAGENDEIEQRVNEAVAALGVCPRIHTG